jgi:hypothetical protein
MAINFPDFGLTPKQLISLESICRTVEEYRGGQIEPIGEPP